MRRVDADVWTAPVIGDGGRSAAVIFDLDGVLVDAEIWWDEVRIAFARRHGRTWTEADRAAIMGANSFGWSTLMRDRLDLPDVPREVIEDEVVEAMVARYGDRGRAAHPWGRRDGPAGRRGRCPWPSPHLAIHAVIAAALDALGIADVFARGASLGRGAGRQARLRMSISWPRPGWAQPPPTAWWSRTR